MWHLPPNAIAIIAVERRNQTSFSVVGNYLELCITYARRHARAHKDKQAHNRTQAYTQVNVALRMHCDCQEPGRPLCWRQPIQNRSSPHIHFTPLRPAHTLNHTTPTGALPGQRCQQRVVGNIQQRNSWQNCLQASCICRGSSCNTSIQALATFSTKDARHMVPTNLLVYITFEPTLAEAL